MHVLLHGGAALSRVRAAPGPVPRRLTRMKSLPINLLRIYFETFSTNISLVKDAGRYQCIHCLDKAHEEVQSVSASGRSPRRPVPGPGGEGSGTRPRTRAHPLGAALSSWGRRCSHLPFPLPAPPRRVRSPRVSGLTVTTGHTAQAPSLPSGSRPPNSPWSTGGHASVCTHRAPRSHSAGPSPWPGASSPLHTSWASRDSTSGLLGACRPTLTPGPHTGPQCPRRPPVPRWACSCGLTASRRSLKPF